jgi:hypothetical protein
MLQSMSAGSVKSGVAAPVVSVTSGETLSPAFAASAAAMERPHAMASAMVLRLCDGGVLGVIASRPAFANCSRLVRSHQVINVIKPVNIAFRRSHRRPQ